MSEKRHTLPTDSAERKAIPLHRGLDLYFPAALAAVARHSQIGGNKHCGGELYHARGKSTDHADCIRRHMIDLAESPDGYETVEWVDESGQTQTAREPIGAAIAWRALAMLQEWLEQHAGAPIAPAARLPEPPAVLGPWMIQPTPWVVRGACFHINSVRCPNCWDVPVGGTPYSGETRTDEGTGT